MGLVSGLGQTGTQAQQGFNSSCLCTAALAQVSVDLHVHSTASEASHSSVECDPCVLIPRTQPVAWGTGLGHRLGAPDRVWPWTQLVLQQAQ